jgi:hypothetical protein
MFWVHPVRYFRGVVNRVPFCAGSKPTSERAYVGATLQAFVELNHCPQYRCNSVRVRFQQPEEILVRKQLAVR